MPWQVKICPIRHKVKTQRWHPLGFFIHNVAVHKFYLFLMVVPIGLWIGGAGYFWWQRRRKRFRDDVELDDGRRVRTYLIPGIVELLICLGFTVFWTACVRMIAEYMV